MTEAPRPFRRRIFVNTLAVGASNIWSIVVSVIALPLTLRGLGTEAFGTWVLLSTFSAMTGWFSLADLGIGAATTREVALRASLEEHDEARRAVASSLVLFGGLGLVFAALFAWIGPQVLPSLFDTPADLVSDLQFAIVVFAVQVLVDQLTNAVEAVLDGYQRVDLSRSVDAIRRTAVAGAVAVVAIAGGGLRGVAVASLGASAVGAVVASVFLHRQERQWWRSPTRRHMRSLIAYGKTIAVLQPLGVIQRQMDRLIVGTVLGPSAVTLVEIATQIQNGTTAILVASSYAAAPASSWVQAREEHGLLRELLVRGTKYSLLLTYPVTVGAILLSRDLVHVWVGPTYAAAAGLAALALLDTMVSAPMQVSSNILIGSGRASSVLRTALLTVAINLVASVVLVHLIGAAGVFVGTLISLLFFVPLLGRAACRLVETRLTDLFRLAIAPALVACVPLAVTVALIELTPLRPLVTILVSAVAGGSVYLAVTARFVLSPSEREEIRSMFRRGRTGPHPPAG